MSRLTDEQVTHLAYQVETARLYIESGIQLGVQVEPNTLIAIDAERRQLLAVAEKARAVVRDRGQVHPWDITEEFSADLDDLAAALAEHRP